MEGGEDKEEDRCKEWLVMLSSRKDFEFSLEVAKEYNTYHFNSQVLR